MEPAPEVVPGPPVVEEKKGGKTRKISRYGTRRRVYGGSAEMTTGGLRKQDLHKNQYGRIVSLKRHTTMKTRTESK